MSCHTKIGAMAMTAVCLVRTADAKRTPASTSCGRLRAARAQISPPNKRNTKSESTRTRSTQPNVDSNTDAYMPAAINATQRERRPATRPRRTSVATKVVLFNAASDWVGF